MMGRDAELGVKLGGTGVAISDIVGSAMSGGGTGGGGTVSEDAWANLGTVGCSKGGTILGCEMGRRGE
jgi:phage-related minor tail protein